MERNMFLLGVCCSAELFLISDLKVWGPEQKFPSHRSAGIYRVSLTGFYRVIN